MHFIIEFSNLVISNPLLVQLTKYSVPLLIGIFCDLDKGVLASVLLSVTDNNMYKKCISHCKAMLKD